MLACLLARTVTKLFARCSREKAQALSLSLSLSLSFFACPDTYIYATYESHHLSMHSPQDTLLSGYVLLSSLTQVYRHRTFMLHNNALITSTSSTVGTFICLFFLFFAISKNLSASKFFFCVQLKVKMTRFELESSVYCASALPIVPTVSINYLQLLALMSNSAVMINCRSQQTAVLTICFLNYMSVAISTSLYRPQNTI